MLTYKGGAQDLWNEIPKATRDLFKVTTMDDHRIVLGLASQTGTTANNGKTGKSDDCDQCYWKLCNYDVVKTFQGKLYRGINYDDGTYYFNCDDGVLVRKVMYVNGNGVITRISTDTLLITGGPVGTRWGVFAQSDNNGLLSTMSGTDLSTANQGGYTLIAKNISTDVNGKHYDDVVVVNYKGMSKDPFFGSKRYSSNSYYARGVGLIRLDTLNADSDPVAAINKKTDTKAVYTSAGTIKNGVDETITGLWKYHDPKTGKDAYYQFRKDGTFDYYTGSVSEANKMAGVNRWKIEERGYDDKGIAVIDLTWAGSTSTLRYELSKKNDAASNKPAISIQGAVLVAADDKKPW